MASDVRVNYQIRARQVRTIDADGKQIGILPLQEALKLAEAKELDLVEVAPNANPPVCRIMDYGKYRYEQSKREREAHKKQIASKLKEIRLRPNIDQHDYEVKLNHAKEFLEKRHKLRISIMFRGREIVHKDLGMKLINKFIKDLEEYGTVESGPKYLGRTVIVTLGPISKHGKKLQKSRITP